MYEFRGFYIPERMMGAIDRYINNGIEPGNFLSAIITNNLFESVGRADEENVRNLPAYVGYFYNEAPSDCWGSVEKMEVYLKMKKEKINDDTDSKK